MCLPVQDIAENVYTCTVYMNSAEFQRIMRDISALSELCTIEVTAKEVAFSAKGDIADARVTVEHNTDADGDNACTIECSVPVCASFASRHLREFAKCFSLSRQVRLSISADQPLIVNYQMDSSHVKYYLAPKFEYSED